MKTCSICGEARAWSEYYESCHATCKGCYRKRARAYRIANIERVRDYDRNRPNKEDRAELNRARYRKRIATPEGKKREFGRSAQWIERNLEKRKAHTLLGNAIRDKKVTPQPCERCGFALGVHGHHEDYSKPLDVVWLCRKCHGQRHREINAERRSRAA